MKTALIVPTNRERNIQHFLRSWSKSRWDAIFIIEDSPSKTFDINVDYHYSWKEINEDLKDNAWIIGRQDSSIRSYGYLQAYLKGFDFLYTLDDDCLPVNDDYINLHIENMENTAKWANVIPVLRNRGIPFFNKGILDNINLSYGLWNGVPDLSAPDQLVNPISNFIAPKNNFILAKDQYYGISGMNLAWKRDVTPCMYFQGFWKRYDDIFAGIILKRIFDYLNYRIICGSPCIYHSKASDPIQNLIKESSGIEVNEWFWEIIENIKLTGQNVSECMLDVGRELENNSKLSCYGKAIQVWVSLLSRR